MPALYVVATPVGNLEDITLRALRTLREVKLIAAEDTRKTRRLLNTYDIKTPSTSYHEHNKLAKMAYILSVLESADVALVSDAGTPGLSDPGYELIRAAAGRGVPVIAVPGPAVVVIALTVSGLPLDKVVFIGFLPNRGAARRKMLAELARETGTIAMFEAPHRLQAALADILATLGDREIAVCRELTKVHEEVFRSTVSGAIARFTEPRGEFTLVVAGYRPEARPSMTGETEARLQAMSREGVTAREAVARLAGETGVSKKELYRAWLRSGKARKQ
ncbi:MAG: 16S rRNA (cytidine(1402)-2'-O)-methyltransferase [Chloroflexi bacterium]|nr:16S rRNA (cytidine(1402)-2'-O)-methyltransferase [Chloroflexota bacterium]